MISPMNAQYLKTKFEAGLSYQHYLATDPGKAANWNSIYDRGALSAVQQKLLDGFTRDMKVLCISGIWCGDCAQQCPLIARIAEASPRIELRWLDRDAYLDLTKQVMINQGLRVPVVIFMAEDCEYVSSYGDRTLTRYRSLAARQLGGACPLPGAPLPDDELKATQQDWLDEFERVNLLLRLSTRLRQKHGD
jgi:hypothetical protein